MHSLDALELAEDNRLVDIRSLQKLSCHAEIVLPTLHVFPADLGRLGLQLGLERPHSQESSQDPHPIEFLVVGRIELPCVSRAAAAQLAQLLHHLHEELRLENLGMWRGGRDATLRVCAAFA